MNHNTSICCLNYWFVIVFIIQIYKNAIRLIYKAIIIQWPSGSQPKKSFVYVLVNNEIEFVSAVKVAMGGTVDEARNAINAEPNMEQLCL